MKRFDDWLPQIIVLSEDNRGYNALNVRVERGLQQAYDLGIWDGKQEYRKYILNLLRDGHDINELENDISQTIKQVELIDIL